MAEGISLIEDVQSVSSSFPGAVGRNEEDRDEQGDERRLEASDVEGKQAELQVSTSSNEDVAAVAEFHTIEDGELQGGEDTTHENTDPESNTGPDRELLSATNSGDEKLRFIVAASQREQQEQMNWLEKELKEQKGVVQASQVELGRRSFLEEKENRITRVFHTSRALALKRNNTADSASYIGENVSIWAGTLDLPEPKSCPPTGQRTVVLTPDLPVFLSRDHNVDLLPVSGDIESPDGIQLHGDQAIDSASGENSGGDADVLMPINAALVESSSDQHTSFPESNNSILSDGSFSAVVGLTANSGMVPQPSPDLLDEERSLELRIGAVSVPPFSLPVDESISNESMHSNEWERLGARPKDRQPMPFIPPAPDITGISNDFLARHSQDRGLLESIRQASKQEVLSYDSPFPGAHDMEHVTNIIKSNRADPYRVEWPVPMQGGAIGGSAEQLNDDTGMHASQGNTVADAGSLDLLFPCLFASSGGADRWLLSEAETSQISQVAAGNGACDQQSTNVGVHSRESLVLAHRVGDLCALVEQLTASEELEQERERNRSEREALEAAPEPAAFCQPLQLPLPCTSQSLDTHHSNIPEFWQDVARRRAQIEEQDGEAASGPSRTGARARLWCTCVSGELPVEGSIICPQCNRYRRTGQTWEPDEHGCTCHACREMNEGHQPAHGIRMEESRPDAEHDQCCVCLEDVFNGCCLILPCSHKVHKECCIVKISNDEFICPICGQPFLGRG